MRCRRSSAGQSMRLLSARSGVRIPPSTPSCVKSLYIKAFLLFIDSFENLFENLYKITFIKLYDM